MAENIEYTTTGKPHPFHIVRPSIWPMVGAFSAMALAIGALLYMQDVSIFGVEVGFKGIIFGTLAIIATMFFWWKEVIFETTTEKVHNKVTEISLRYGMMLFIASEVMFFVAFFWAFFNGAFYPTEAIGFVWPPKSVDIIEPFGLPFLMTMILLLSGCTVTWAHHAIRQGDNEQAVKALGISAFLGAAFLCFQIIEYGHATFGFSDGIYSSTFYMATGFHGFHVFIGTVFLTVCWIRAMLGHFTKTQHFGFEAGAWYWHFVDVVWLFLFISVYWWGNTVGTDATALIEAATAAAH